MQVIGNSLILIGWIVPLLAPFYNIYFVLKALDSDEKGQRRLHWHRAVIGGLALIAGLLSALVASVLYPELPR
jgi:hypothetical protein